MIRDSLAGYDVDEALLFFWYQLKIIREFGCLLGGISLRLYLIDSLAFIRFLRIKGSSLDQEVCTWIA